MEGNTQIFGIRAVIEAIQAGKTIDKIFIQRGLKGNLFSELNHLIQTHHISSSFVPAEKLNRLTRKNHQGVIANISPVDFYDMDNLVMEVMESGKTPLFLLLDQLSDARNFGAIIRTAECTGVNGIIIQKKGGAPVTADTVKTSAGAVFNVPICKVDHIKDAIYYLQSSGVKVIAATEKTENTIYDVSFKEPVAVVMGAEDKGISASVLKIADEMAKLPMKGKIGSLNVSVACGAFLYEALRQRI
ncbi:23S rRNA (guanosine(2251)-2'-O)-methyltransferase RlmB [Leptobacterium flavescens]|uniref:23S rRNA (Guanosine(2251)-2'-O)-methyltransferase RlmB n=1 Tax=Leptobacterium flavescens TaxID=472055 RepID=A0A6P0UWL9_9FLAO|nr:23S rRNA (guanosine(2251)-2'-O)-methyltransferase RlmB [Leptobacterium flavescens]NER15153.1 23S rRNA (guanosine(2251)-2'-O)-methyltransferase RlmB [Leptobacterium flavescens]